MKYNPLTRRMFLQGAGKTVLAIPFLPSLLPREAQAQSSIAPKRFISLLSTYDIGHNQVWLPNGSVNPQNIPQPNRVFDPGNGHHPVRWQPLRDFAPTNGDVLGSLYSNHLSPYLESMNILRSLDLVDLRGHDCSKVLGGVLGGDANPSLGTLKTVPTIDQFINANRNFNPAGLPLIFAGQAMHTEFWSLAQSNGAAVRASVTGGNTLESLYNALFNGGNLPETGDITPTHPRRALLNRVIGDFNRTMSSRNISGSDRVTLSDTMDLFSDIHRNLERGATTQCSHKGLTKVGSMGSAATSKEIGKAVADMITAAIKCDSARVFTIGTEFLWGIFAGEEFDHQKTSHRPFDLAANGRPQWEAMSLRQAPLIANILAPLVQNLSSAIDPSNGKSYLYNSLILQGYESGQVHGAGSQPGILLGNAGGSLASGNYIDYADRSRLAFDGAESPFVGDPTSPLFSNNWRGVSYNRLMVTILQAMGITQAEYENNALNSQLYNRTDLGSFNQNLNNIGGWGYAAATDLSVSGYVPGHVKTQIPAYDLKQYRYRLPLL